jgi:replication factor C subunit 3/5
MTPTTTTKNMQIPWVEKYRPTEFQNIIFGENNKIILNNIMSQNEYPNMLFYGPPGTGKTTTIINIIKKYQTDFYAKNNLTERDFIFATNYLQLNASDERGIDVIRNQIMTFVECNNTTSINGDKMLKFVILDEADYMTKNAQLALKTLIQTSTHYVRFFLICNYISKIEKSLQNELTFFQFNSLPKDKILSFVKYICNKENVKIDDDTLEDYVQNSNDDVRKIINFIQLNQHATNWEKTYLTKKIFDNIWEMLFIPSINADIFCDYFCQLSCQYRQNKLEIFVQFAKYIIENKTDFLTNEFMELLDEIIHKHSGGFNDYLHYFFFKVKDFIH